jgi:hypothetical protein
LHYAKSWMSPFVSVPKKLDVPISRHPALCRKLDVPISPHFSPAAVSPVLNKETIPDAKRAVLTGSAHTSTSGTSRYARCCNRTFNRESGVNPELPRSGKRERPSPSALVHGDWEAVNSRCLTACSQVRRPAVTPGAKAPWLFHCTSPRGDGKLKQVDVELDLRPSGEFSAGPCCPFKQFGSTR